MNRANYLQFLGFVCGISLLMGGCLIKPGRVPTRRFILAPISPAERDSAVAQPVSVEVAYVKMPSYLLRDSMAVRKSPTEIEYLEDALWAERLDQSFRQVLSDDLSSRLDSGQTHPSGSEGGDIRVSVEVQQFDVDSHGQGTLVAGWRLTLPGSEKPAKTGLTRLARPGPPPLANPQIIATTLSALTAQFSQELAAALGARAPSNGG